MDKITTNFYDIKKEVKNLIKKATEYVYTLKDLYSFL